MLRTEFNIKVFHLDTLFILYKSNSGIGRKIHVTLNKIIGHR